MPKIPDCDCKASRRHRCSLYARNPHLICTVHPNGVDGDRCLDFRPDPNIKPEEQWSPEGYSWYDGHLVRDRSRYTQSEQWEILNTHPFFTGVCPQCKHEFDKNNSPAVHWDWHLSSNCTENYAKAERLVL